MFYWKYSTNRVFLINEYWILIPPIILADVVIINTIRAARKKNRELKLLKEQIENYKKQLKHYEILKKERKILFAAYCLVQLSQPYLTVRGGDDNLIDVRNIVEPYEVGSGFRYIDDQAIRSFIHKTFVAKSQNNVIFITVTALCQLVKIHGLPPLFDAPWPITNLAGFTSVYVLVQKTIVTLMLGAVGPLYVIQSPSAKIIATVLGTLGLKLARINFEKIPTTEIFETSAKAIKPRIPGIPEVVTVNFREESNSFNGLKKQPFECFLGEQTVFNPNCQLTITPTSGVNHGLTYDDVVNMNDVTKLNPDVASFTDIYDLGRGAKPAASTMNSLNSLSKPEVSPNIDMDLVDIGPGFDPGEAIKIKN